MDDAFRLIQTLTGVSSGNKTLQEAVDAYDADVVKRGGHAVETAIKEGSMVQDMDKLNQMLIAKRGLAKE